jgi:hypothetical protein
MRPRTLARVCALVGVGAALAIAGPAVSHGDTELEPCTPGGPSTAPPTAPPSDDDPAACRAAPARILESGRLESDRGYHHLGATTAGGWAGVSGRLGVRDAAIRPGTYDFLASRFMVKRELGGGDVAWLEAGWAETGWAGEGRQRVYTYDTNNRTWRFYDAYALRDGDKVWLNLRTAGDGVWQAWLWWNDRWNLLSAERLPLGTTAQVEQYVEVHVDQRSPATVRLPAVEVDNVQLTPPGGGVPVFWRENIETLTGETDTNPRQRVGAFCVDWTTRFDTWSAADC